MFQTGHIICPVSSVIRYISLRGQFFKLPPKPFFVNELGEALTRNYFISHLKILLDSIGVNSLNYNGHSFRIGAATSAQEARLEDHLIKTLGRWTSDCYTRYIHTSSNVLKKAQVQIANTYVE